ncbi:tautomerase family protein [Microbispora sp. RL4-1S]|uniref:Tautomerase family protein n=1 Tax=Microbispora oryzae TaxID=2806554 RepID=A0A940WLD5_9ACTN|nr:tautomerase family protein [Microbispora oryzae]MBP2703221.1 tautomerase family protein [Microbispora oryzae]
MPLVRIDVLDERDDDTLAAIGDAVHLAMTETIDVPADDLFQVINRHPAGHLRYDPGYMGIRRDNGIVFIAITMRAGRTVEQKKALYRRITELAADKAGVEPRNVLVSITENELVDWSFGNGDAQLLG